MGRSYSINDGSWFGSSYDCSDISSCDRGWDDCVGRRFTKVANSTISDFNSAHQRMWEKMEPLLSLNEDQIQYTSQDYEIERLWVDE